MVWYENQVIETIGLLTWLCDAVAVAVDDDDDDDDDEFYDDYLAPWSVVWPIGSRVS